MNHLKTVASRIRSIQKAIKTEEESTNFNVSASLYRLIQGDPKAIQSLQSNLMTLLAHKVRLDEAELIYAMLDKKMVKTRATPKKRKAKTN